MIAHTLLHTIPCIRQFLPTSDFRFLERACGAFSLTPNRKAEKMHDKKDEALRELIKCTQRLEHALACDDVEMTWGEFCATRATIRRCRQILLDLPAPGKRGRK